MLHAEEMNVLVFQSSEGRSAMNDPGKKAILRINFISYITSCFVAVSLQH